MSSAYRLGDAVSADIASLAAIWRDGWREAHLGRVPDALVTVRTAESFTTRAAEIVPNTVVARVDDADAVVVVGFVTAVGDEVEELYVHPAHRGTGVAGSLLTAAEAIIASSGHFEAWLAVVAGNTTARAFYERHGWRDRGLFDHQAPGPRGAITVPAHRYVKALH
jgi:ribosomal protein S18 acetylase RimI-like enzyme